MKHDQDETVARAVQQLFGLLATVAITLLLIVLCSCSSNICTMPLEPFPSGALKQ